MFVNSVLWVVFLLLVVIVGMHGLTREFFVVRLKRFLVVLCNFLSIDPLWTNGCMSVIKEVRPIRNLETCRSRKWDDAIRSDKVGEVCDQVHLVRFCRLPVVVIPEVVFVCGLHERVILHLGESTPCSGDDLLIEDASHLSSLVCNLHRLEVNSRVICVFRVKERVWHAPA